MSSISHLINHPERLNKETLYDLRSLTALYPYYQPARLLLLQNLFLLHDPTFDEELRRAAIYITDRRKLFQLVEGAHYQILTRGMESDERGVKSEETEAKSQKQGTSTPGTQPTTPDTRSTTIDLINNFLDTIPEEYKEEKKEKRRPTPADATVDYVAYLLETEKDTTSSTQLKGQTLIDNFINQEGGSFSLKDEPEFLPDLPSDNSKESDDNEGYFTETLARIYIKQGRYSKALEIIQRLNLVYPKKNRYFADQIRFLEKLIQNNNKKTNKK